MKEFFLKSWRERACIIRHLGLCMHGGARSCTKFSSFPRHNILGFKEIDDRQKRRNSRCFSPWKSATGGPWYFPKLAHVLVLWLYRIKPSYILDVTTILLMLEARGSFMIKSEWDRENHQGKPWNVKIDRQIMFWSWCLTDTLFQHDNYKLPQEKYRGKWLAT